MLTMGKPRMMAVAVSGLATLAVPLLASGTAHAHGYTEDPPSRQAMCAEGKAKDCGPVQWEPQSVEGPGNFPKGGPKDGHLCSAGNDKFDTLDDQRGGKWPATKVKAGQDSEFRWKTTAAHKTESYRYFITKDGWNPSKPLTRDQLEPAPFLEKDYHGKKPGDTETQHGKLPADKKGKHMILGVWEIADTNNAFYSCSDVNFS